MFEVAATHSAQAWVIAGAMLLAFAIDHCFGEPPVRWHPVVWMGNYLNWAASNLLPAPTSVDTRPDFRSFLVGACVWLIGVGFISAVGLGLQWAVVQLPALLAAVALACLFKPMFAWRMLRSEVHAVEIALQVSQDAARTRLSMLVSRNTATLTEAQVRETAIETLAENLNDSVIAPLFWFALLGLPGAAIYRFANTADAMWGYKGFHTTNSIASTNDKGRNWEWAGKFAARADDVLSWLPARLTAALLWLASGFSRSSFLSRIRLEAVKTPSPNSGWPMAAMALILNIQLSKPLVYTLNTPGRNPDSSDVKKSIQLSSIAVAVSLLIACSAMLLAPVLNFWVNQK